jgi:predicted DNA-binding protein
MPTEQNILLRLPPETIDRLDAHCEKIRRLTGLAPSRGERQAVIRMALEKFLDSADGQEAGK